MAGKNRAANRNSRRAAKAQNHGPLLNLAQEDIGRKRPSKALHKAPSPLNDRQADYEKAINSSDITFGIGPAGTGKTWYAAMMAAHALNNQQIEKIIVTRPAVEAGESLGFLPGEQDEKYEPYFRPVRDALEEYFGAGHLEYLLKSSIIEARPLAYIRGSSIKNTWLIADEMQNATKTQTLMLLTRIGEGSKFVINGDPRQTDLPARVGSGLMDAVDRIGSLGRVRTVRFGKEDIVRHGLIREIIEAYENSDNAGSSERYNESTNIADDAGLKAFLGAT